MLNIICIAILVVTFGAIIFAFYNAIQYRKYGKVFTFANFALLNTAFNSLFAIRTILFLKPCVPNDINEIIINMLDTTPKIQGLVNVLVKATPDNILLELMFWAFASFFAATAIIRGITGYKVIRPRFLLAFLGLISTLSLIDTANTALSKYETLFIVAFAFWIASIIAVKIQTTINISRQQKAEFAAFNDK
ncbi:MAG TPA: hypothetical protein GX505_14295 [Clostridiales bacterium]|nr:hypothetical protein [Clostridiales bacterium]